MRKSINIFYSLSLILVVVLFSSCKEVTSFFSKKNQTSTHLPTDKEIIKILHTKISKEHFEIMLLSKKLKSLSKIKVKREKFDKGDIIQSSHEETCKGLQINLVQKTKQNCSFKINHSKKGLPYTNCLKSTKTHNPYCKEWIKPLSFAKYCKKDSVQRHDKKSIFLTLPKDHNFKTSLRIEMCQLEGESNYSLRKFKLDEEALPLNVQKI